MPIDLTSLLERVSEDEPVGSDLRASLGIDSLYLRLKDARSQGRSVERAAEASGEPTSVPPAWSTVRLLATEALAKQSKDLEVTAWLVEALVRLEGFPGLAAGFTLIDGLIDRYWPYLHSNDEDDSEGRLSPLAGLNGVGGEGVLIQPIRMISLVPDHAYGTNALWHTRRTGRDAERYHQEFLEARAATGSEALRTHADGAREAHEAFQRMSATLDAFCGADAPPVSNIRSVLEEVLDVYRGLLGEAWYLPAGTTSVAPAAPQIVATPEIPAPPAPGASDLNGARREISSRDEAFDELLRIAAYFRRAEPHSPISYAIETTVRRGRMSLMDLLTELIPDSGHRSQFLQQAGIDASGDGRAQ